MGVVGYSTGCVWGTGLGLGVVAVLNDGPEARGRGEAFRR